MHQEQGSKSVPQLLPVFSLLVTATLWGIAWYPLRVAESHGLNGLWTALTAYGCALLVGLFVLRRYLKEFLKFPGHLALIGLANGWTNIAFILAVIDGNVVRVILLFYLSPVWTTLLGWLFLKEALSRASVVTLVVAMLGALIMLWEPAMGFPWPRDAADVLAISSGIAFSVGNVAVRKLQAASIQAKTLSVWMGVVLVGVAGIWLTSSPLHFSSTHVVFWTAIIGGSMIAVMTVSVQYGVTNMPVYRSAVILLFELIAAAVSSQLLSDEVVTLPEWFGGALIMTAAYFSARSMMKLSNRNALLLE